MSLQQLNQNVNDLTRETTHPIETDNGTKYVKADPLLTQLREAVHSSSRRGGAASSKASIPLSADALDLWNEITATATEYWALFTQTATVKHTVEERIQAWAARVQAFPAVHIENAERITTGWVNAIDALFNPRSIRPLQKPCPHCGELKVLVPQDDESVVAWALTVDVTGDMGQWSAYCAACATEWDATQIPALLAALDYSPVA